MNVLHVKVAEPMGDLLDRARTVMESLEAGEMPEPYFGIGFETGHLPQQSCATGRFLPRPA